MGRKRSYDNGKPLPLALKKLVIDKVEFYGGSIHTGKVPRGTFAKISRDLSLHKTTVSKTWNKFLLNGTHEIVHSKPGKERILSSEDVEYIRDLIMLKPTLYKREIRELVLQNTNSYYPSLSRDTIARTVRTHISCVKFTSKRTQRSNKRRWTDNNMLYTRNFINFMKSIDVYRLRFIDKVNVNCSNEQRHFGASESGSCCVDISAHPQGQNHTIFSLVGLNNKCFTSCVTAPTDGTDFINFVHDVCTAFNNQGEKIIEPGLF